LCEGSGQLFDFPWRSGFAGLKSHHDIANAHSLTRFQREVAGQAVALVEQTKNGHALGHRSGLANGLRGRLGRFGLDRRLGRLGGCCRRRFGRIGCNAVLERGSVLPSRNGGRRNAKSQQAKPLHAASGLHAS
jgi:hypothetical protein